MEQRHFHTIDLLRGIAALSVGFFHVSGFMYVDGEKNYLPPDNWLRQISLFGDMGVQMFFVITGFILPWSMQAHQYKLGMSGKFIGRRLIRLEPPYLASLALLLFLAAWDAHRWGMEYHIDPARLVSHLGYLTEITGFEWYNAVYWSLAIEFQFYLLLALAFPLMFSRNNLVALAAFAIFLASPLLIRSFCYLPFWTSLFSMGIITFYYLSGRIPAWLFLVASVGIGVLIGWQFAVYKAIAAWLTAMAIAFLNIRSRVGKFLGDLSYSFYLIHGLVAGQIMLRYFSGPRSEAGKVLVVFLTIGLTVLVSWLFSRLLEQPFRKLAGKIKMN